MLIGLAITAVCLAALGVMLWLVWHAPIGWQDDDGFHYGEPDELADPDNFGAR